MGAVLKFFERARENAVIGKINRFINSKYMLVVFAVVCLLTNVFALELWTYTLAGLFGIYLCLFGKDMLSLAPLVIFTYISPSIGNNPRFNPDSVFFPENGLILFIVVIAIFLVLFLLRLFLTVGISGFLRTRRKLLVGFLVLGAALLLNGLGYEGYTAQNLLYALLFFAALFALYLLLPPVVDWREVPKDYFAWMTLLIGLTVSLELINVFVYHAEYIFVDGSIVRNYIYTGWGTYNTVGAVLSASMPGAFYLAVKKKHGFVFSALGTLIFLAVIASNSRGSMLMGGIVYVACVVMTLINKKNRIGNLVVFAVVAAAAVVVLIVFRDKLADLFASLLDLGFESNGRWELFRDGLEKFTLAPIFGAGFFSIEQGGWGDTSMSILPYFWHDTFIQMLGACGIVGLGAYLFHRWQTLRLLVKNPSWEKNFIAACVGAILLTSLIDCHLFNIGITFIYSVFLLFGEKSEESARDSEDDPLLGLIGRIARRNGATADVAVPAPTERQTVLLWKEGNIPAYDDRCQRQSADGDGFIPYIESFPARGGKVKGAVLICPGGAFQVRCMYREGYRVAKRLSALGYQCFAVAYRLRPYSQEAGALDLARAVRYVRGNAEAYGIKENNIAIIGFSAGGILCGEFLLRNGRHTLPTEIDENYTPDMLDYVPADVSAVGHIYSFYGRLSVANNDAGMLRSGNLPPAFFAYGAKDPLYSQFFCNANALREAGLSVEEHVYRHAKHGFGAGNSSCNWIPSFDNFLTKIFE